MIPEGYKLTILTPNEGRTYEASLMNVRTKGTVSAVASTPEEAREAVLQKFYGKAEA